MKAEKKSNRQKILLSAVLVALVLLTVYQLYASNQQSLYPANSISTTLQPFTFTPIPYNFFNFTNSTGCLLQKGSQTYEHYMITVTNRFNQIIHYVNASIELGSVTFTDFHYPDITGPLDLYQAGPTDATTWTFPIDFPMSGIAYGTYYAGTSVMIGLFGISICIRIGSYIEGPFLIDHSDMQASYLATHC